MVDLGDGNTLVITTETRDQIVSRVFILVFFNGIAACISIMGYFGPRPWDLAGVSAVIAFHMLVMATTLGLLMSGPRGTWVIDLEGIAYHPCRGEPRRLTWKDVERVQWSFGNARLQGRGVTIRVPWSFLSKNQAGLGRERVEKLLTSEFDLTDPVRKVLEERMRASGRGRLIRLGVAILALMAVWWVVALGLATRFPGHPGDLGLAGLWNVAPQLVLVAVAGTLLLRQYRACRRFHPAWPWRLRAPKPGDEDW